MASEYLKWKYRDVKPDAPVRYTNKQKAANWWHYHKWWLLAGAVLLICVLDILLHALGVGAVKPDYQLAYVASTPLSDETLSALEAALSGLGEDCSGDHCVVFRINPYVDMADSEERDQPGYAYAASVKLMADLEACESYFFICDDPETLHANYDILAHRDGGIAGGSDALDIHLWQDCPTLAALDVDQAALNGLYLARRGFWQDRVCQYKEACDAMWAQMTEGAKP